MWVWVNSRPYIITRLISVINTVIQNFTDIKLVFAIVCIVEYSLYMYEYVLVPVKQRIVPKRAESERASERENKRNL